MWKKNNSQRERKQSSGRIIRITLVSLEEPQIFEEHNFGERPPKIGFGSRLGSSGAPQKAATRGGKREREREGCRVMGCLKLTTFEKQARHKLPSTDPSGAR